MKFNYYTLKLISSAPPMMGEDWVNVAGAPWAFPVILRAKPEESMLILILRLKPQDDMTLFRERG